MLMKLPPVVNSTNILWSAFGLISYNQKIQSQTVSGEKAWQNTIVPKSCPLNVDKIATCSQFCQHFYVRIFRTNVILAAFSSYIPALASKFRTKNARLNVDEIDTWRRSVLKRVAYIASRVFRPVSAVSEPYRERLLRNENMTGMTNTMSATIQEGAIWWIKSFDMSYKINADFV